MRAMGFATSRVLALTGVAAVGLGAGGLDAQLETRINAGAIWESYSFDDGLGYSDLSEFSLPVVVDFRIGDRTSLLFSTGFASVQSTANLAEVDDVSISGLLDTEARLTFEVVPRYLSVVVSGVLPTGVTEVATAESSALGLIASEVLDFTIVRLGSGGGGGIGVVGAVPVGSLAAGLGVTFSGSSAYTPVAGEDEFDPGSELRIRAGVEGPVGRTTYLRVAGIYAARGEDEVGGVSPGEPGGQFSLYSAVEQGLGTSTLSAYVFGSGRSEPVVSATPIGLSMLPESRTFALGVLWSFPLRRTDVLTPSVEYRMNDVVPLESDGGFEALGRGFRFGAEYRLRSLSVGDLILHGDVFTGEVGDPTASEIDELAGVVGYRLGVRLETRIR